MKNIIKLFFVIAVMAFVSVSCIKETQPESGSATAEQVGASSSALQAALNGIPSQMSQGYYVYGSQVHETDMAFPQLMIAQTEMLGDMYPLGGNSGYDWYRNYNTCDRAFGETSYFSYLPWFTLYRFIKASNDVISTVDMEDANVSASIKTLAGAAYAARAFNYYMLTVLFEPVENIYTDCSKVLGLTVPIITDTTSSETAKNNPRVKREDMIKFILSDLDIAEKALSTGNAVSKLFPGLAVVYGIKAKVYLWNEQYAEAATFARKAIESSGASPVTKDQWLDLKNGFNTANQAWMWYIKYDAENMGNLCNFIGWMSGEADWGYSSLSMPGIDKSLYDKISDTDFRKYSFLDPKKYDFYDYETSRKNESDQTDSLWIKDAPAYLSLKFRCKGGDYETYSVGGAVDVPVMRVEEMYFIEAEAIGASQGVAAGVAKLNDFMKQYRDPEYNFSSSNLREFQLEVLTQMRIEFWGEGNAFPTAKRLKPDVIQNYQGTNAPADIFKINFKGIKPNWTLVIPINEIQANVALEGLNNPDPTGTFKSPTPIGEFAQPK